jgi:hypothetical protein
MWLRAASIAAVSATIAPWLRLNGERFDSSYSVVKRLADGAKISSGIEGPLAA